MSPARFVAALATAVLPVVVALTSIHQFTASRVEDFRPFLNDEVYYWHQTATFAATGFNGGFYTIEEVTPAASVSRFGAHGPWFPILCGAVARTTGWYRHSAPLFNGAVVCVAVFLFAMLARPALPRMALLAVLVASFWPIPFWIASNMQESLHHAVALVAAGCLAAVAAGRRTRTVRVTGWTLMTIATLVRPSWAIVLVVWAVFSSPRRTLTGLLAAGVLGGAVAVALLAVFNAAAAPYPGNFFFLRALMLDASGAAVRGNLALNVSRLLNVGDDFDPLEIVNRVEYLAVLAIAIGAGVLAMARRGADTEWRGQWIAHAVNLGSITGAMLVLYSISNWTEYRVVSAHLLLALAMLTVLPGRLAMFTVVAVTGANLIAGPVFASSFAENKSDNFAWDRRPLRIFEERIVPSISYDPSASPWCNTLLSSQYPPDFITLPPGIGISVVRDPTRQHMPPRSKYLLLDDRTMSALQDRLHVTPLAAVSYGRLYLNLDAHCPATH